MIEIALSVVGGIVLILTGGYDYYTTRLTARQGQVVMKRGPTVGKIGVDETGVTGYLQQLLEKLSPILFGYLVSTLLMTIGLGLFLFA